MQKFIVIVVATIICAIGVGVYSQELPCVELDVKQTRGTISPQLFGNNLEITRKGVWRGLSAEMIANRKFAASEQGMPKRWSAISGDGQVAIDDRTTYAGKQSVRIELRREGTSCGVFQAQEALAFQKDARYILRLWLKTDSSRTVKARIGDAKGNQVFFEKAWHVTPGEWRLVSEELTASATSENSRLEISSQTAGVFWIGAVSLQPVNAFHGMRRDVVELLKQIKPGSLRYPGGCYAEFYRWQEGFLPVDERPPIGPIDLDFVLPDGDNYDSHEIGVDEFIALCREVGCEPAITMRLCENTPEDAAAWVEYCNGAPDTKWGKIRAQRGQTETYNVKCWFVGNELYFFGRGGLKDAEESARQTQLFASAMKKADPTILLVGCTYAANKDWNKSLIGRAGDLLDLFSVHCYLFDAIKEDLPIIAKASTQTLRPILQNALDVYRQEVPKDRRVNIVLDEWNLKWGSPGNMGMGLNAANTLNLLCRESPELAIERAYFFMPVNEGAIRVTPLDAKLDVVGEIFKLYAAHQGNLLLKTPAITADADIDLCASADPNGGRIYATVVNRSVSHERSAVFELRNFSEQVECAVNYLIPKALDINADGFNARNENLKISGDKRWTVKLPPCAIARMCFEKTESLN